MPAIRSNHLFIRLSFEQHYFHFNTNHIAHISCIGGRLHHREHGCFQEEISLGTSGFHYWTQQFLRYSRTGFSTICQRDRILPRKSFTNHNLLFRHSACLTLCDPMDCVHQAPRPWDFLGKNTGEGCHFLFQWIFPTQGLKLCLLHWQVDSFPLSHQESPRQSQEQTPNCTA